MCSTVALLKRIEYNIDAGGDYKMLHVNLRILMAHNKIDNVSQLAKLINITPGPIHNLYKETNVGSLKLETLMKICDGLGCKLSDLIEYTPDND